MKTKKNLLIAAMFVLVTAGAAEAAKGGGKGGGGGGGGGGGVSTNYGCQTFKAGYVFTSSDGLRQKSLLMNTYACYLCNMTTKVCDMQSPSTLVGWTFRLP